MSNHICLKCNNEFASKKTCKSRTPKYCSKQCYAESLKLNIKCKNCNQIIENKNSASLKNRIYCSIKCSSQYRKNKPLSEQWKKSLSLGRKNSIKCKGENLYNWKGGDSTIKERQKLYFYKRKTSLNKNISIEILNKLLSLQGNNCFYCESELKNYKAIEHLTPISRGGDNDIFNLVYACKSCNSKKRQKTLEEYAIKNDKIYLLNKWENIFINLL